jgi:uncharacterized protein (TIGR02217 family)
MADFSDFHDVRFPTAVSFGATGGPERINEIVLLTSGVEHRNARVSRSRRRYDAGTGVRSLADLEEIVAFFEARRGSLHSFRFRDPFDRKSSAGETAVTALDQNLGIGNGSLRRFGLAKVYGSGSDAYRRVIACPVAATLKVAVNGVAVASGNVSFDAATSEIVFAGGSVPGNGLAVTAGYEFDVQVRFDTERLSLSLAAFRAGQIPTIPLVEVLR